jgi:hypothetical protein
MLYYRKEDSVISTTHPPKNIDSFVEITEKEYLAFIEEIMRKAEEEEAAEQAVENI